MEQQDLALPLTFAQLRATRFRDELPQFRALYEYIEQLAVQTSTNIDAWEPLQVFRGIELTPLDRRAVNKAFFAKAEEDKQAASTIDPMQEKMLEDAAKIFDDTKIARIKDLIAVQGVYLADASRAYNSYAANVKKHWEAECEKLALENRPANFIGEEVKKLISEGFWSFKAYKDKKIELVTAQDIILTEKNTAAGIDRRVNMGKYFCALEVTSMQIKVDTYKNNIVSNKYYHPYIGGDGDICWGNGADTAKRLLANGKVYEVFKLLSSLLTTYSPDSTPWCALSEFDRKKDCSRHNGAMPRPAYCDECDEERAECGCGDWCSDCDSHVDDCECIRCDICDTTFPDGERTCGCCQECETPEGDCTCCPICQGDFNECNCCNECYSRGRDCIRCRECDSHDGHTNNCNERPVEQLPNDIPF